MDYKVVASRLRNFCGGEVITAGQVSEFYGMSRHWAYKHLYDVPKFGKLYYVDDVAKKLMAK